MLLGQELKFKNKLCNLKLGTFFSALLRQGIDESNIEFGSRILSFQERRNFLGGDVDIVQ